jgi:hypothetical protein
MRTRKEITGDAIVYDCWVDHRQRSAIIELLLDIRELLEKKASDLPDQFSMEKKTEK